MSEINVEFTAYFEDEESTHPMCDGLDALAVEDYAAAKEHFATADVDLWIESAGDPTWFLEGFSREGGLCEGSVIAHESGPLDPTQFLKRLASLGPHLLWGSIVRETGEQRSVGFRAGAKYAVAKLKKELIEVSPNFALRSALDGGKYKEAIRLLQEGADPNVRIRGYPAIFLCARCANLKVVETLLSAGADVNARWDGDGRTALMAVLDDKRSLGFAEALLAAGADPNLCDKEGYTPLLLAIADKKNAPKTVKMLLDAGANASGSGEYWYSPLAMAVDSAAYEVFVYGDTGTKRKSMARKAEKLFRLLLDAGADPSTVSRDGGNLLACAMTAREIADIVRSLGVDHVRYPKDAYSGDVKRLRDDLRKAVRLGDSDTLAALLDSDAFEDFDEDPNLLHDAVQTGNADVVRQLVDAGYDPGAFDEHGDGTRAFDLAYRLGMQELGDGLKEQAGDYLAREERIRQEVRTHLMELHRIATQGVDDDDCEAFFRQCCSSRMSVNNPARVARKLLDALEGDMEKALETAAMVPLGAKMLVEFEMPQLNNVVLRKHGETWKISSMSLGQFWIRERD